MTLPTAQRGQSYRHLGRGSRMAVLLPSLLFTVAVWAADGPTPPTGQPGKDAGPATTPTADMPKVTIAFDKITVAAMAMRLHDQTGFDFVVGPSVRGLVTASFSERPLDKVLDTLGSALGLTVSRYDTLFVLDTYQAPAALPAPSAANALLPATPAAVPGQDPVQPGYAGGNSTGWPAAAAASPSSYGAAQAYNAAMQQQAAYDTWQANAWQNQAPTYQPSWPGSGGYNQDWTGTTTYWGNAPIGLPNGSYINAKGQMVRPDGTIVTPSRPSFGSSGGANVTFGQSTGLDGWIGNMGPSYHSGAPTYRNNLPTVGSGWRLSPPPGYPNAQSGASGSASSAKSGK